MTGHAVPQDDGGDEWHAERMDRNWPVPTWS
jgi:hypothetical protein